MFFVGITGGVGAGKSAILDYIKDHYNSRVILADQVAHDVMEPGTACYEQLKTIFQNDNVYQENGQFDRPALAAVLFSDHEKRSRLNAIVHPAVGDYVFEQIRLEREADRLDLLVYEAALLIEKHFDEICDELWYIYTSEDNRRNRLKANRGYSDEKISNIFATQLTEEVFREHCREVIDNNRSPEDSFAQVDEILARKGIIKRD